MVGFILAEGSGRRFPAEDVDAVFHDGCRDPAPGRRKISLACPPIGYGVVFLGDAEVLAVLSVQPAGDRDEAAGESGGARCPGAGGSIVPPDGWGNKGAAWWKAPNKIPLSAAGGGRHFGAFEQGRRLGAPLAL